MDGHSVKLETLENTQDMTYDLDPNTMTVHVSGTFNYRAQVLENSNRLPSVMGFVSWIAVST